MWRSIVLGTLLGVAGVTALFIVWLGVATGGFAGINTTAIYYTAFFSAPGALILSIPLTVFLRRRQQAGKTPQNLLILAAAVGAGLGLVNLVGVLLVIDSAYAVKEMLTSSDGPLMLAGAAAGGLGLGLGCFWGLPRKRPE